MQVHKVLYILLVIVFASCCKKMMPVGTDTETKDSTHTETIIRYHSDTVRLPGDTVSITVPIPCPDAKIEQQKTSGKTTAKVSVTGGMLRVDCMTDSLNHVIDSLKETITTTKSVKTEKITVYQPVEVVKKKIPFWVWLLIAGNVGYIWLRASGKLKI